MLPRLHSRRRARDRALAGGALVALVVACAPSTELENEVTTLQRDLAISASERQALDERVAVLEDTLAQLSDDDRASTTLERLEETDAELARLVDALTVLEEEVAILDTDAALAADEVAAALADLRGSLSSVQGDVEAARGDLELLDTLYTTLRERLDRLDVRVSRLGG